MASLLSLPNEVLILMLEWLGRGDVASLLIAQRTCRTIHELTSSSPSLQAALFLQPSGGGYGDSAGAPKIHSFLLFRFACLFDSNFPPPGRRPHTFITSLPIIHGTTVHQPLAYSHLAWVEPQERAAAMRSFRSLPWAGYAARRERYLRKEASWRRMLVASGPPITKLAVARKRYHMGQVEAQVFDADLQGLLARAGAGAPAGLTMGMFYDLLLDKPTFGLGRGLRWKLFVGKQVAAGQWAVNGLDTMPIDVLNHEDWLVDAPGHAVLHVYGDPRATTPPLPFPNLDWTPEPLGETPEFRQHMDSMSD